MHQNSQAMPEKVRVDKWLWSVRLFKSRTQATDACRSGKVRLDGEPLKSSYPLEVGQVLEVRKNGFNFRFKVLKLIEKRVGAPLAQQCYEDLTPQEELDKYRNWFVGKAAAEKREKGAGRPTKKERRIIERFKDDLF